MADDKNREGGASTQREGSGQHFGDRGKEPAPDPAGHRVEKLDSDTGQADLSPKPEPKK